MQVPSQFPASILRHPSPDARCTCTHWVHCNCTCHRANCDPGEDLCDLSYLPDDGGLTNWGCERCTPGDGAPHLLGCELIGWHVPIDRGLPGR
jgi:hypothetical protein